MSASETQRREHSVWPGRLLGALVLAAVLGIGLLILQRYVAQTRYGAIQLVAGWFIVVGIGAVLATRRRPEIRVAVLGTFAAILIATVAIGYLTGFRDRRVDEDIVVAARDARGTERLVGLRGAPGGAPAGAPAAPEAGPVRLLAGSFAGVDGHSGGGRATVVGIPPGRRLLTFSRFDVDPGLDVRVYLVAGDGSSVDDRVDLGELKGNVGDQQYAIPADTDLRHHGTVVLYCVPFTVRVAVAELSA